jgi:hypothetical protein
LLLGTIGAFRRRHPGITVVLLEGTDPEVRDWVLTGVVDVGLVTLPIEGVESIVIAQDDMRAIVPARHPRATQPAVRPAQLGREPFILVQGGCGPLIRAIFHAAGITPRVQFEFHDMATILAMVQEELGVTLVPTLALPLTPIEVRALPHDPPVQRPIGLVVRSRHAASSAVTALIHQARTWAKAHGYGRERVPPPSLCRIVGGARPLSAQLRDVHVRRATRGLAWRYHPRQITKVTRYPVPGRWPGVTYRPISVMGGAGTCWRLETLLKPSGSG